MKYYVDQNAAVFGKGTQDAPFKTISEAAKIAVPGDEVIVAPGVYREYVDPVNAGTEEARITYRSAEPLQAVITGAEPLTGWEHSEQSFCGRTQPVYDAGLRRLVHCHIHRASGRRVPQP